MGLLSTLAGIRSGPGTGASAPEPVSDGAPFLDALMGALGLAGRSPLTENALSREGTTGEELHSLLAMLAESAEPESDVGSPGTGTSTSGATSFGRISGGGAMPDFSGHGTEGSGLRSDIAASGVWGSLSPATPSSPASSSSPATPSSPATSRSQGSSSSIGGEPGATGSAGEVAPADAHMVPGAAERLAAAAVTGTGATVSSDLPVTEADPSLDKVAPALRARVERVIERMRAEFGHEVTVVEGYRSPDRQAHLYEQGRSRPGDVATWTRRSWHSEGLAADLMVDGTYDDPLAYARLQRVAREEGLKTLGSRDMGHVELPGSTAEPEVVATRSGRRFVGVAQPAPAAAVAAVAQVATPGQWVIDTPAAPAAQVAPAELEIVAEGPPQSVAEAPRSTDAAMRSDFGSRLADAAATSTPTGGVGGTTTTTEAGGAEQAARIEELRAMTEMAQPSRVSVRLDGGDQMRIGLLDRTVDATMDISDPDRAAAIRSRVAELHQALEVRGLDLGGLSVNGTPGSTAATGWLGAAGDPASEILRTLLGGGAGGQTNDGRESERTLAEERTRNQEGSDSNRSRRDADQERDE